MLLPIIVALFLFKIVQVYAVVESGCTGIAYSNICAKLDSKYYLINANSELNWFEAERFCRRQGGFLATIESADELQSIAQYLRAKKYDSGKHFFWISGNDLGSEGVFYSIATGALLPFTDWVKGQPDNYQNKEHCLHLWKQENGFRMNDENCERKTNFICELGNLDGRPIFDVRHST